MTNQGAIGTGSLTLRGLLTRDLESFGPRYEGAGGTLGVPFAPLLVSLETESFGRAARMAETLAAKAHNAKRPAADLSALGVNWRGFYVRRKPKSSPGRTRTYDKPVNSRLLYQLSYRGV